MHNQRRLGILALLTFQVGTAFRDTFVGSAYGSLELFQIAFIAFLTASLCFSAILGIKSPQQIVILRKSWRWVLAVNITTAIAWLGYFAALARVEPAVVNTIFSGISPVAVTALALLGFKASAGAKTSRSEHLVHIGLAGTLVVMCWVVLSGRSGLVNVSAKVAAGGLALAFTSGIVITAETVCSKRLNELGVSPSGVLGVRFLMVTLIAGGFVLGPGLAQFLAIPLIDIGRTALLSLVLIAAPLLFVQFGLARTSPMTTAAVLALNPLFVLAVQAAAGRVATSPFIIAVTLAYSTLAGAAALLRRTDEDVAMRTGPSSAVDEEVLNAGIASSAS